MELFTLWELLACLVNLIENLPCSGLETFPKIILQLTYIFFLGKLWIQEKRFIVQHRKMSLKIKAELFEDKQKNFLCLGTSKTLSLGEFHES